MKTKIARGLMPIGVGVIGANPERGWGSTAHLPAITRSSHYELRAVSTSRAESAVAAEDRYRVPAFSDYRELLDRSDIDLVAVTVKVPLHRDLVADCLSANKMVYCEWPLGNGTAEAEDLAALARKKGIRCAVGLQARASPTIRYVKQLVESGRIGDVLSTSVIGSGMSWGPFVEPPNAYNLDIRNGATMLSIACGHALDAISFCLGEITGLKSVVANQRTESVLIGGGGALPMTAHDQVAILGNLASGAILSFHYRGGVSLGNNLLWEINGTKGDILISADSGHLQIFELRAEVGFKDDPNLFLDQADQPVNRRVANRPQRLTRQEIPETFFWDASIPTGPGFNVAQAYAALAEDIQAGSSHVPDFDDAVKVHHLLDTVLESAQSPTLKP